MSSRPTRIHPTGDPSGERYATLPSAGAKAKSSSEPRITFGSYRCRKQARAPITTIKSQPMSIPNPPTGAAKGSGRMFLNAANARSKPNREAPNARIPAAASSPGSWDDDFSERHESQNNRGVDQEKFGCSSGQIAACKVSSGCGNRHAREPHQPGDRNQKPGPRCRSFHDATVARSSFRRRREHDHSSTRSCGPATPARIARDRQRLSCGIKPPEA